MTYRPSQDELLGWIEGELSPADEARVAAALEADPSLRERVEAMRADRAALRSMSARGGVRAPAGLIEDALAEVERRELLGAPADDDWSARAPAHRTLRITPMRMAAAAAVLLLALGGTIVPLIGSDGGRIERPVDDGLAAGPVDGEAGTESLTLADAQTLGAGAADSVVAEPGGHASPEGLEMVPVGPPAASRHRPPSAIPLADALELARSRRLLLRVTAPSIEEGASRVARAERTAGVQLAPATSAVERAVRRAAGLTGSAAAASEVRSAEVGDDAASLARLLDAFAWGEGWSAGFEAMESPVPAVFSTDPDDLLWWEGDLSRLETTVTIPVLIERVGAGTGASPGDGRSSGG